MAVLLSIKSIKPSIEVVPEIDGRKTPLTFGVKVYSAKEAKQIRKDFFKLVNDKALGMASAAVDDLKASATVESRKEESYYDTLESLEAVRDELAEVQETVVTDFYRSHILYIKNASVSIEENGAVKDVQIPDTSKVVPVESLWKTPSECLVVLLEAYYDITSLRDSLNSLILNAIFSMGGEEKGKNSK